VRESWFYGPDQGGASDIYRCGGAENYTGYCQRLVTRDLASADRILDPAQRARVLNQDVPAIFQEGGLQGKPKAAEFVRPHDA
jgi:hypothetical protein